MREYEDDYKCRSIQVYTTPGAFYVMVLTQRRRTRRRGDLYNMTTIPWPVMVEIARLSVQPQVAISI